MSCGCGGGSRADRQRGAVLGYRAYLPGGEIVPPPVEPPYFMAAEAMRHTTTAAGGTILQIRRDSPTDLYAITLREQDSGVA